MFSTNRDNYRETFFTAWQKHQKGLPLEPLDKQLVDIITLHPEYQPLLEKPHAQQEFAPEDNPFLHMGLHLAIREQIHTNRPTGITDCQQQLLKKYKDPHDVEHRMMTTLAQILWEAQQSGVAPSEQIYLEKLKML